MSHKEQSNIPIRSVEQSLRQLLDKIAAEQKFKNHEIIVDEISTGGANYTSKLFTVIIREANKDDLHLFAKVATIGEKFREEIPPNTFRTERFFYQTLLKAYESLEEENGVPEEHKFLFPKSYGFDPTLYQETVVLENLVAHGFNSFNRFTSIDWEYASSATLELAKMHALSIAYSEKYPEAFEKVVADIKMEWKEGSVDKMTQGSVPIALKAVKPEHREALEKFLEKYLKDLLVNCYASICRNVLIHGDFRGDNLLHRVRKDGKMDIKIVDLQTLQGGCPVSDLLFFIFTGSDEQFRAQYSEAMKRLHLNPDELYSREDFDYELKEKLPFGLAIAVFTLPIITVKSENAPQVDDTLLITSFTVENTSDLYTERLNGVVNDYVKWGLLN